MQDAYVQALRAWERDGLPDRPGAWLTTVARRNALNLMRRQQTLEAKLPLLVEPEDDDMPEHAGGPTDAIPDDRLRLIFTCCHPALAPEAQVALTLRLVCGVATPDIARAFLVADAHDGRPPDPGQEEDRRRPHPLRGAVRRRPAGPGRRRADRRPPPVLRPGTRPRRAATWCATTSASGRSTWRGCCGGCCPTTASPPGCSPCCWSTRRAAATRTDARRPAPAARGPGPLALGPRADRRGRPARGGRAPGRPAGAVHAAGGDRRAARAGPDLRRHRLAPDPGPLRRAAAGLAVARGRAQPGSGGRRWSTAPPPRWPRSTRSARDDRLAGYRYLPATQADLLRRLGRHAEAADAYRAALALTDNAAEQEFLTERLRSAPPSA